MFGASQVALVVKNPLVNAGDLRDKGSVPGSGRSPGNPLQYSCLENPVDRGAWRATVLRRHDWGNAAHTMHTYFFTSLLCLPINCKSFPGSSTGKESSRNTGDLGLIPGLGRSPGEGKGYPLQEFWPGVYHRLYSPWGCKESDTTEDRVLTLFIFENILSYLILLLAALGLHCFAQTFCSCSK